MCESCLFPFLLLPPWHFILSMFESLKDVCLCLCPLYSSIVLLDEAPLCNECIDRITSVRTRSGGFVGGKDQKMGTVERLFSLFGYTQTLM